MPEMELQSKRRFIADLQGVCPGWQLGEALRRPVSLLWQWAVGQPGEIDPCRGLWLWGNVGTGKSTLLQGLRIFAQRTRPADAKGWPFTFAMLTAPDIAARYAEDGYPGITGGACDLVNSPSLAIDEIGAESIPANNYGTKENVVQYLLQRRYDRFKGAAAMGRVCYTFATTNLSPDDVADVYGARIFDRCKEMFNFVQVAGYSMRRAYTPAR